MSVPWSMYVCPYVPHFDLYLLYVYQLVIYVYLSNSFCERS